MLKLGDFEAATLLAVKTVPDAYGVNIKVEVTKIVGYDIAYGAVYTTLSRLERKGYVSSYQSEPTAMRGGRRRRYYKIEDLGTKALEEKANETKLFLAMFKNCWTGEII